MNTNLLSGCFWSAMHSFPQNRQSNFQLKCSADVLVETFQTLLATSATQSPVVFLLRMMFPTCFWQLSWIKKDLFSCCFSKRWDPNTSSFSWFTCSINDAIHLFFINNPFLTLASKIVYTFLKNRPKQLFSNCLVDGQLISIV